MKIALKMSALRVENSRKLGVNCGTRCTLFIIVLCILYLLLSLACSLVTRLYLKAYYVSAHVSALATFVAAFTLTHHLGRVRICLGYGEKNFYTQQCVLNILHFLCHLAMAFAFSILIALAINWNLDYVATTIWAWVNSVLSVYMLVLTAAAARSQRYSKYELSMAAHYADKNDIPMRIQNGTISTIQTENDSSNANLVTSSRKSKCSCKTCLRIMFNIVYYIFHVLFILFLILTVYNAYGTIADIVRYREDAHMYTVKVDGHRPLALYFKCRGSGNTTIVQENGLGGSAFMSWDFLPHFLKDKYTVCVHDRRGYSFSESFESDYFMSSVRDYQNSSTNTEFFKALVDAAGVSKPFYYMGHSYGGHHIVQMAVKHPEYVKGLVFLDSMGFSVLDLLTDFMEVILNFKETGAIRFALQTGLFDYQDAFKSLLNAHEFSPEMEVRVRASFSTGLSVESYYRERTSIQKYRDADSHPIKELLAGIVLDVPVLVIDADSRNHDWFPEDNFSLYNTSYHFVIAGSTHTSIVMGKRDSLQASILIDDFIRGIIVQKFS